MLEPGMDFHSAFTAIDTDGSGEIDMEELRTYCKKMNYKESFVQKWLNLFDEDDSGTITYEEYCNTLGLIPKQEVLKKAEEVKKSGGGGATSKVQKPSGKARAGPRNSVLSGILMKYSRGRIFQKKALYRIKTKSAPRDFGSSSTKKEITVKTKQVGGEKNGGTREVVDKRYPGSYPTQERKRKVQLRKKKTFSEHPRRLRSSITPGTVLILLTGRHRGKRVVFIRQLESGLLMVSGPLKLNGCPMRRVSQRYVIATKTKIDVSSVKIPDRVNDTYFKRAKEVSKAAKSGADIFQKEKQVYELTTERKADQKEVDASLVKAIKSQPDNKLLFAYLSSRFSLKNGHHPHKMQF